MENLFYKPKLCCYNKIMKETRHEEYAHISNNLPFILHPRLKRTPSTCRSEKNWHENIEIQVCLDGEGYVLLDGDKYPISKGDIAVVNSNSIHYTYTPTELTYTCIIIDTAFCKQMDIKYHTLNFASVFKNDKIIELTERLTDVYLNGNSICKIADLTRTVLEILIEIVTYYSTEKADLKPKPIAFDRIKRTIKFIRENYNRKLTLEEIAKNAYCDKFTLSREFKKLTGQTIVNYLNSYRCQKAVDFIENGENVIETAYKCGFENPSFFTKTFKKHLGVSPSKFKNN